MKMYEVLELSNFYMTIRDMKMPIKLTYKFSRLMQQVELELKFYQENFKKIVEEFAKKDEKGNYIFTETGDSIAIMEGKEAECNIKIAELQNLEVDIKGISFTLEELESLEDLNLTISEMSCLIPLIAE